MGSLETVQPPPTAGGGGSAHVEDAASPPRDEIFAHHFRNDYTGEPRLPKNLFHDRPQEPSTAPLKACSRAGSVHREADAFPLDTFPDCATQRSFPRLASIEVRLSLFSTPSLAVSFALSRFLGQGAGLVACPQPQNPPPLRFPRSLRKGQRERERKSERERARERESERGRERASRQDRSTKFTGAWASFPV